MKDNGFNRPVQTRNPKLAEYFVIAHVLKIKTAKQSKKFQQKSSGKDSLEKAVFLENALNISFINYFICT